MTSSLTTMQFSLMNRIAHDQYNTTNGATPTSHTDVNCWLWADEFAADLGLTGKQVGGLLTTLTEKGFLGVNKVKKSKTRLGGEPDESTVWFTEAGFAAWQAEHLAQERIKELEAPKPAAAKRGPAPEYSDDRGLIGWVQNPKKLGSASYDRYGMYAGATTVGAFIAMGGTRADLRWELAHGHVALA